MVLREKNINVQNERDKAIDISNLHFSYNENDESRDKNKMRAQLNFLKDADKCGVRKL